MKPFATALLFLLAACASSTATRQVPDATELSPAEIDAFRSAADALDAGDAQGALETIQPLAAKSPWHLPSHALRQDALLALGRAEEAASWYAGELRSHDDAARRLLAARVGPREGAAREAAYREALRKSPSLVWAKIALAYELARRSREETDRAVAANDAGFADQAEAAVARRDVASNEAVQLAAEASAERPELAAAHGAVADVLLAIGPSGSRLGDAQRAAQRSADLDPASAKSWERLARAKRANSDDAGAAQAYEKAVEIAPRDARLRAELGRVLLDLRRDADAAKTLSAATRLDAADATAAVNYAVALFRTGNTDDAAAEYARAAKLAPSDPRAWEGLARARAQSGDRVGAAEAMERYLAAGGTDRDAAKRFIEEMRGPAKQ